MSVRRRVLVYPWLFPLWFVLLVIWWPCHQVERLLNDPGPLGEWMGRMRLWADGRDDGLCAHGIHSQHECAAR